MSDWSKCLHNPNLTSSERRAALADLDRTRKLLDANPGVVFESRKAAADTNRYLTKEECTQMAPFGTATYPRTRRSWRGEAQSFIDLLLVLLLASVFLNVYLAVRLMEASR